jgi:ribosomal protein S18 acetylase RimI-like enzyme
VIHFRPFRNSDPPLLAEVWRSQPSQRGLMQPMSPALFEQFVLSKSIFEPQGLILATNEDKVLGFVHAGFGANADETGLSTTRGVTSMLMIRAPEATSSLAAELLEQGENYLRSRGAAELYAGGIRPLDPFYLGLYGGSELSGILESDTQHVQLVSAEGYEEAERTLVLERDLASFRPAVDRGQMQLRRRTSLQVLVDPPTKTWWEACTFGEFDRTRFELQSRDACTTVASVTFWNIQPLSATWGVNAAGLIDLEVAPAERRQGVATYLLGEAFRHLSAQGLALVEVQVREGNESGLGLFEKLGFEQVDRAVSFRKR